MNSHEVGRGRGGLTAALATITAATVVAGVDTDRLYPLSQQERLADGIPGAEKLQVITSPFGHDAFLLESDQLAQALEPLV
jgi:homoserine O-acetyltransferase